MRLNTSAYISIPGTNKGMTVFVASTKLDREAGIITIRTTEGICYSTAISNVLIETREDTSKKED